VLGLGTGITLGAVAAHPGLEEIVLGEIEPAVLGARPFFAAVNGDPLGDPRLQIRIQDGRNVLKTSPRHFDVITADPIHPWTSGSVYLYTAEYYQIARDHLTPLGVMCQWLPITGLASEDVRSVIATFASVFPHTSLWQSSHDVLLIGSTRPIVLELEGLAQRIAAPRVRAQLAALGLDDPIAFLAEQGMDDGALREYAQGALINTDDNVHLEFSSPLSIGNAEVGKITLRVNRARSALAAQDDVAIPGLAAADRQRLRAARHAKNRLLQLQVASKRELERLQQLVAEQPEYRPARIQLARRLSQQGSIALEAGREDIAFARSRQALAASQSEASAHLLQGALLVQQGRARMQRAHTRARLLGQPMARLAASWYDALFEVRLQNPQRVAALAEGMQALVDECAVMQGGIAGGWFRGWAQARSGEPREGYRSRLSDYLNRGEMAFIPMGEIHGTYNPFAEKLVFLAILSPAQAAEPGIVDVSTEEPWASLRRGFPPVT
jgi:spermidine synthase